MANFEDFLNDYDLGEPQEEDSLDLPEIDSSADNSYEADFEPEYNDDAADYSQPEAYYPDVACRKSKCKSAFIFRNRKRA